MMTKLIDIDELADYLKLKKQTIYNWLSQGKISGIKVGGVWRFDRKDVHNWLKSSKCQPVRRASMLKKEGTQ